MSDGNGHSEQQLPVQIQFRVDASGPWARNAETSEKMPLDQVAKLLMMQRDQALNEVLVRHNWLMAWQQKMGDERRIQVVPAGAVPKLRLT